MYHTQNTQTTKHVNTTKKKKIKKECFLLVTDIFIIRTILYNFGSSLLPKTFECVQFSIMQHNIDSGFPIHYTKHIPYLLKEKKHIHTQTQPLHTITILSHMHSQLEKLLHLLKTLVDLWNMSFKWKKKKRTFDTNQWILDFEEAAIVSFTLFDRRPRDRLR